MWRRSKITERKYRMASRLLQSFGIGSLENYWGPDIFDVKGSVPVLLKIAPQGEKMEGVQNSKQSTQNL